MLNSVHKTSGADTNEVPFTTNNDSGLTSAPNYRNSPKMALLVVNVDQLPVTKQRTDRRPLDNKIEMRDNCSYHDER